MWNNYTKWQWFLMSVGVLCVFYITINLFTSVGNKIPPPRVTSTVSFEHMDEFEEALAASVNSTIEEGSPITILTNGAEFLPDLLREIQNAQKSINITDYIWDDGEFGNTLFQALIEKAHSGVAVRILLDGVGGRHASEKYIEELNQAGGQVVYFRPVRWWNVTRINGRTHMRDFVIDGEVAYMGGIAISDDWLGNATSSTSWHDFMFKMDGQMARNAQEIFANIWSQTTGEILVGSLFFPVIQEQNKLQPSAQTTHFIPLLSTPMLDMSANMEHFIWLSLSAAEKSIYIENPYILPNRSILEMLKNKARDGVDVELIVPGEKTDAKHVRWASRSYYGELLDAGVRIFEYQPSRIHAKTITIDTRWSIIGSANLDNRSSQLNLEAIVGTDDVSLAHDLETKFTEDTERSKEIHTDGWGKDVLFRPLELLSRLFIKQY